MSETLVLDGIGWETYEHLLEDLNSSGKHVHLTYDRGCLEIEMSTLPKHESRAWLLSHVVEVLAEEWNIPYLPGGSTTFRRGELGRGAEPDACYYLRGVDILLQQLGEGIEIDSATTAPDIVIEVDITNRTVDKFGLYAQLGVSEIWQDNGFETRILVLENNNYTEKTDSLFLPALEATALTRRVNQGMTQHRTAWLRELRTWAHENQINGNL
jgi:Uma2 family endonuclease